MLTENVQAIYDDNAKPIQSKESLKQYLAYTFKVHNPASQKYRDLEIMITLITSGDCIGDSVAIV
jgi:hypothetical protein